VANLLTSLFRRRTDEISRFTLSDYVRQREQAISSGFAFSTYPPVSTYKGKSVERAEDSYSGLASYAYRGDSVVAACMRVRRDLFRQAKFCWREIGDNGPGKVFRNDDLALLDKPWSNGTSGELLARMITDVDLCGNSFILNQGDRLRWLRPDWVSIILSGDPTEDADIDVVGYVYTPGGTDRPGGEQSEGVPYKPDQICHWSPEQDPMAFYRGMSWVSKALEEVHGDRAATTHKLAFFRNGATLGPIVRVPAGTSLDQFKEFVAAAEAAHAGAPNAYKAMYVGGGAEITLAAADFRQLDLKSVQGGMEPLALDTPIPTPSGWTTMGNIEVGDLVIGSNGEPARVLGVSPVHVGRDCYRVTLKDRSSIVADASHLWAAADRNSARREMRTYTTQEMLDQILENRPNGSGGGHRFAVPAAPIVDLPDVDLLVDPYVLGAWLGDGQTAGAAICGDSEDLKFIAAEIESRGYMTTYWATAEDKVDVIGVPGGLLAALRALGVLGDKRIPQAYLRASIAQRLDLLRGLMDTDGHATVRGQCIFSSKFEHMARQVAELLRSLGYRATVCGHSEPRSRTAMSWNVRFRVAPDRIPFLLPRKADRCLAAGEQFYSNQRSIVSIEPVDSVPVRCIAVDTDDHLFLAGDGFIPTHNTRIAAVAGVHPVLVGLSESLAGSSLNSGNFAAARRSTAEMTLFALWQDACGALQAFFEPPDNSELWIREKDIPFLREERKDQAEITKTKILAIEAGMRAGFKPDPMVQAVETDNLELLVGEHTGLFSVQMQPPGAGQAGVAPVDVDGDGVPDSSTGQPGTEPIDFAALRADLPDLDDDELERALDELYGAMDDLDDEDEDLERNYHPDQLRIPKGFEGGGRFRGLAAQLVALLKDWKKGDGPDDPIGEHLKDLDAPTRRKKLCDAITDMRKKRLAAGDHEGAARLVPRRGASEFELKLLLYKDAKGGGVDNGPAPKAPPAKAVAKKAAPSALTASEKRRVAMLATIDKGDYPGRGLRDVEDLGSLKSRGLIEEHDGSPHGWRLTDRGHAVLDEANAPTPAKKATPATIEPAGTVRATRPFDQFGGGERRVIADGKGGYIGQRRERGGVWHDDPALGTGSTVAEVLSGPYAGTGWRRIAAPTPAKKATPRKAAPKAPVGVGSSVDGRTTAELREIAKAEGIPLPSRGSREELAQTIRDHRFNRDERVGANVFSTTTGKFGDAPLAPAKKATPRKAAPAKHPDFDATGRSVNAAKARQQLLATDSNEDRRAYLQSLGMSNTQAAALAKALGSRQSREGVDANIDLIVKHFDTTSVTSHTGSTGYAPSLADAPDLTGLTTRQKRARLKAMGYTPEQVDELAPTAAMAKKAAAPKVVGPRPSGLPHDRKPESGDFDDLADRVTGLSEAQKLEIFQDLNGAELARLAAKFPGGQGANGRPTTLKLPAGLTLDEKRRWLAKTLSQHRWHWRSVDFDPDDVVRGDALDLEDEEELDDEDDDEPVDEMDLALEHYTEDEEVGRAAGHDVTPGHDELHHWWTKGSGLARWVGSPHPWTTLRDQLLEHVPLAKANRMASKWFFEVFGIWSGERKGQNPVGPG
jgi:hypothetical protein